ncbi:hypothetical protein Ppa06_21990 [Planomonospora parontospora subsp. parontospora]|uniref:Uncharacterized protein n=2 Tax=Planomonospora parontospora TaxID=58119 RepID=A0AA37BGH9_9ACTN|nr:hypothetical protein [Planomonospora parontospora]GGK65785.1 hypothetical protein GCM10010126_26400 [Planomonospora parontospora]GII08401.1 hypothetical protein Ppa06_21990 [Planomonospora parontospora subsp. parontospora]
MAGLNWDRFNRQVMMAASAADRRLEEAALEDVAIFGHSGFGGDPGTRDDYRGFRKKLKERLYGKPSAGDPLARLPQGEVTIGWPTGQAREGREGRTTSASCGGHESRFVCKGRTACESGEGGERYAARYDAEDRTSCEDGSFGPSRTRSPSVRPDHAAHRGPDPSRPPGWEVELNRLMDEIKQDSWRSGSTSAACFDDLWFERAPVTARRSDLI